MNRHAKASSAGSTERQASGLGGIFRGAFATRGGSGDANGSGAPSARTKLGALALLASVFAALVLLLTGSAVAAKSVSTWIGTSSSGELGGQFSSPRGVAVNSTGAGGVAAGTIYVADTFNNRIQQFSPSGAFVRAWGFNVIQFGKPGDLGENVFEVCEVAADCKSGIGFVSPAPGGEISEPQGIAVDQATGAVYVTEQGYLRVQKFSATGSFQAAFGKDVVQGGPTTTEACTVASECKAGESGEAGGEFTFSFNGRLAVAPPGSPNAGDVYVADPGNRRIQRFDSSGAFVAAFGGDVETPAGGDAFEVCTVAADCKAGSEGAANGEFANGSPNRVAVDDAGRVYAVDNNNARVQRFTSAPAFDTIYGTTQLSGSESGDIAIDPGAASAGDATDDHVFVAKPNNSPSEYRIRELGTAADPSLIDTHMSNAGIGSLNGLAVDTASNRLLVSSETGGQRVYLLDDPLPAPTAVADAVAIKTDTTATFTGSVNPEGGNVACRFQYATAADFSDATDVAAPDCEALAISGGSQAISANATGLLPNTAYHLRLQVFRPFVAGSTVTSGSQSFATDSVPPVVSDVGAVEVEDTSARLVGTIDPRNAETSYVFEYGTTPALGSSTAPLAIGGGTEPVVVSQVLTGLSNDTDYFFRLVATNDFGSTPSPQVTLHTRTEPLPLPDDRAYEQVSPVDKNFGNAVPGTPLVLPPTESVALDGQAMAFGSVNSFGAPPGQVLRNMATYISHREDDGWHTQPVTPNGCAGWPSNGELFGFLRWLETPVAISANGERAVIPQREEAGCATPPLDPAAPLPATNLYRVNFEDDPISYDLLVPAFDETPNPQHVYDKPGTYAAASDDFSHIYYGAGEDTFGVYQKFYEWDNGVLRLASVDPNGDPFTTFSSLVTPGGDSQRPYWSDAVNSVSSDGSRFFFQNPIVNNENGPVNIYMRESGVATYDVTESECTASCGSENPEQRRQYFQWASADGEVVTFSTPAKLVNADTQGGFVSDRIDLYAYRHSPNPTAEPNLTLLTQDNEPADGTTSGYREVLGMADDGNTVFFVADGQLVAGKPTAAGPKVYRWSWNEGAPTLQYLASAMNDKQQNDEGLHLERRVTRSGDALMIETKAKVDPAADHDNDIDVYLWHEESGWTCVSCQMPGAASGGRSTTGRVGPKRTSVSFTEKPIARELMTAISEDGERIFFLTQDALVSADVNGPCAFDSDGGYYPCTDLYEWHDGRLSLITTGTGSADVGLIGASESGDDVFLYSAERLVGWDKDNLIDVYDARVGGGLPEPPAQPADCEGEACRGGTSSAPDSSGAGTAVFQGPGNPTDNARKACPKGKRKVRRAGKTRCVKPRHRHKRNRAANNNRRNAR